MLALCVVYFSSLAFPVSLSGLGILFNRNTWSKYVQKLHVSKELIVFLPLDESTSDPDSVVDSDSVAESS